MVLPVQVDPVQYTVTWYYLYKLTQYNTQWQGITCTSRPCTIYSDMVLPVQADPVQYTVTWYYLYK